MQICTSCQPIVFWWHVRIWRGVDMGCQISILCNMEEEVSRCHPKGYHNDTKYHIQFSQHIMNPTPLDFPYIWVGLSLFPLECGGQAAYLDTKVSFHVGRCPPYSSVNKDEPAQMQREFGGVGFVCANQLLPSPQIWAHLQTSSQNRSSKPLVTITCKVKDSLVGAWKSSSPCSPHCIFQRTTRMWQDGSLHLKYM